MNYRVIFAHPSIKRNFEKTLLTASAELRDAIVRSVVNLSNNPRPHGVIKIKPPLDIYHSLAGYRIRIQNYRVFYDIDEERKTVSVIALRRRNEGTYK